MKCLIPGRFDKTAVDLCHAADVRRETGQGEITSDGSVKDRIGRRINVKIDAAIHS